MKVENKYTQKYVLTTNYYDPNNNIGVQGTLDLFQNIAARHAFLLGAGKTHLEKLNLAWVIARTEIEYVTYPETPLEVEVMTWPRPATRFYFDRYYKIVNPVTNEVIAISRSRWVLIDVESRKIVGADRYDYPLTFYHEEEPFDHPFPRPSVSENKVGEYIVRPSDIDENGHLNNSKYGNIIFDYLDLKKEQKIKSITINYANEAFEGEVITISREIESSKIIIAGHKGDTIVFNSEVIIK
ncbi:MAG: Acyl-ACP thioesterase [Tenericutes bacterium ADurb.Bin239]|jgi:medium-chain acyl-[acyl-carrier-protein] hydrolase|nr:MAG: Acyl-ACP thioesterase [Tenericutes bacterium ADurb.Bin239]